MSAHQDSATATRNSGFPRRVRIAFCWSWRTSCRGAAVGLRPRPKGTAPLSRCSKAVPCLGRDEAPRVHLRVLPAAGIIGAVAPRLGRLLSSSQAPWYEGDASPALGYGVPQLVRVRRGHCRVSLVLRASSSSVYLDKQAPRPNRMRLEVD